MPYRPRLLVSVGFSGALQPQQRVGDLVLATEVVDQQGQRWPALRPAAWANRDIAAGRLLTMPELVSDPQEKQRLGQQYEALAVDMESAIVARLCHQHKVPFACLRVISDDWQTALSPHLVELLRRESVSLPRLAGKVLRHPKLIGELWRLARQTRRAARSLRSPLSALILAGLRTGDDG
jgi:adenosylhomocysteine nucleosidase